MDLILPDFGLLFWTGLVFIILMFILTKFIWKPILSSVNARSEKIAEALEMAEMSVVFNTKATKDKSALLMS